MKWRNDINDIDEMKMTNDDGGNEMKARRKPMKKRILVKESPEGNWWWKW